CRFAEPCSHSSRPPSRFTVSSDTVSRRSSPKYPGRQLTCRSSDGRQGPVQELRAATRPTWLSKHVRTPGDAVASSARIPFTTAVSAVVAGSNTSARSLRAPSPFTSEPTSGVNGTPEVSRPVAVTPSAAGIGEVTVPREGWGRLEVLVGDSRVVLLPALVG